MTEWDASEYARQSQLQEAMAREVLALLELKGSERVLDVGCGDGKITTQIAARIPRGSVVGVDASHEMIAFASNHFGSADQPNLQFQVADARHLPFQSEFDLVVSFNALHWIPEQDMALRSIRSAMKPASRAQLRLVPSGERESLEDVVEKTRQLSQWNFYFRDFQNPYLHLTPEQYSTTVARNGLQVVRLHCETKAWDFGSRAAFFAFCWVGLISWTRRLPEAKRPEFINDVLDRYQLVAADRDTEANTFKFYQMDVTLACTEGAGQ
jgi:trans-aconitate methyltransferase